ncbi:MAG: hypothetical protein HZB16_08050 [Armatimonadetes bacterium]|nr:hypothetical protein [Armatimonadota bacterium]
MPERVKTPAESRPRRGREAFDPSVARFFLALGAVGEVSRAAQLAGVDEDTAWGWLDQIPRPAWLTRRAEAATRMFDLACEALAQTQRVLRGETDECGEPTVKVGLRELVMVAERFFAAALKLDREVGTDADPELSIDLGAWAQAADRLGRAPAPSGAAGGSVE